MTKDSHCVNCCYWQPPPPNGGVTGQCRKNPPTAAVIMAGPPPVSEAEKKILQLSGARQAAPQNHPVFISGWPPTPGDGWCGSWEQIDTVAPPSVKKD